MVANHGSVEVPLLSAVFDCSLEAPSTNLTEVSSDPMCDPKEDISSDPTCDPKKDSFTQLGKRDSLPRIPRYCRQSNQGPRSDCRGRHGLNGPRYCHVCAVSLERISASSVSRPSPFLSYFHVESISAAGIERLTSESTSMFCFATTNRRTSVFVVQPFQVSRLVVILIVALNWSCVNVLLIASMRLVLVASSLQTCFAIELHLLM